ncbi:hypothetical protein MSHOH_1593 [Methanosarcina horonobensis HB-1 = JCM 15518]|uniref:Periplasmic copper-binding protein NosD beta helix domain-containing protein n=1 Tax=Methanosarcina horonobensis HB-1 = JCM 15518 TaxID=1434110 RepID=A0A0E3SB60_9EURY|nr:hypothetical protein MSHOH_1593 [Methanosarcina horonobensis HB-1 = JCM 15518]
MVILTKRILSVLFTVTLALQALTGSAAATTFTVDDNGPGNYTTIQAALNDAVDGDTIIVQPGTYPTDERIPVEVSVTIKGAGTSYPSIGGFWLYAPSTVEGFTITKGVDFEKAGTACTVRNNRFEGCGVSMGSSYLYGNQIVMNNLFTGSPSGVSTYDSYNNTIIGNTFLNCNVGVLFSWGGGSHVVTGNTFKNCSIGIHLIDDSALIYNNYFYNDINLQIDDEAFCTLNVAKNADKNIIGGQYIGGNYWSTPAGNGFSDTHLDTNGDGFAEEPYQISDVAIDHLPLAKQEEEPEVTPPPEPEEPTEDNSTDEVILDDNSTASEDNNTADVIPADNSTDVTSESGNETEEVTDEGNSGSSGSSGGSSHRSSGSSSGGSGGGGSPELARNVEVKELSQLFIPNGKDVKFEFQNNATCVVSVDFDAIKNAGKITTIVEQLKNKSALVPGLPEGEIYKSFNVWVGNVGYATPKNIDHPTLDFKVEKAWVLDKNVDRDSITLNWYVDEDEHDEKNGNWTSLKTELTGEDDEYLYYTSEVSGYSFFAISGTSLQEEETITAESRAAGDIPEDQEGNESKEPESDKNKNALLGMGLVLGTLGTMGIILKSMKKE